jgi:hypothetical protein
VLNKCYKDVTGEIKYVRVTNTDPCVSGEGHQSVIETFLHLPVSVESEQRQRASSRGEDEEEERRQRREGKRGEHAPDWENTEEGGKGRR